MTVKIPHGGRFTSEQLAERAEPTATAMERIRSELNPRLRENDLLRSAAGSAERAIVPIARRVAAQQRIIAERQIERTLEARAAVREARVALAAAQRDLARAQRELTRARDAYERGVTALEADLASRLRQAAPRAREVIDEVRDEALADQESARNGPERDVADAYGAPGTWRRWLNDWNPLDWNGALDLETEALSARMREADRSVTMYQRLRESYERLRPRATDRLPSTPYILGE